MIEYIKKKVIKGLSVFGVLQPRLRESPAIREYKKDSRDVLNAAIAYNQFGGYCVPRSSFHRYGTQRILSGEVFEEETIKYIGKRYSGGDIVHAGAFFGDFLPALSGICADGSKVKAYEPNPESFRCAQITCAINNLENVDLTEAALGGGEHQLLLAIRDQRGRSLAGRSQFEASGIDKGTEVEVDVIGLDDNLDLDRRVSVLHLDLEGYERKALEGAMNTIAKHRPLLIVESVPDNQFMEANILSFGYQTLTELDGNTFYDIV
jgi:FkbM family methyltransferase